MDVDRQVEVMEKQMERLSLSQKMHYLNNFFKTDPKFTQDARNIVVSNILKALKQQTKRAGE